MQEYIKCNKAVADYLGLTPYRLQFPDGNYRISQNDFKRLPGVTFINWRDQLPRFGAVAMTIDEVTAENQNGATAKPLPEATEEQWRVDTPSLPDTPGEEQPGETDPDEPDPDSIPDGGPNEVRSDPEPVPGPTPGEEEEEEGGEA